MGLLDRLFGRKTRAIVKLIERLRYKDSIMLYDGGMNNRLLPEHVNRLRSTYICPYCGTELVQRKKSFYEYLAEAWTDERAECPSCRWWRACSFPDHYFIGQASIGVLQKTNIAKNEEFCAALTGLSHKVSLLYEMNPYRFEDFVRGLLKEFYDCEVIHAGRSRDGGIDIVLLDSEDGKVPVQIKRRLHADSVESVSVVREFRGALLLKGQNEGMIVTTAHHFSADAIKASTADPAHLVPQYIHLVDCRRLLDIMAVITSASSRMR